MVKVTVALMVVPAMAVVGNTTKAWRSEMPASVTTELVVLLAKLTSGQLDLPVEAATVVELPTPNDTVVTEVAVALGARVSCAKVVVMPSTTSVGVKVVVMTPGLLKVTVADTVPPGTPLGGSTTEMAMSAGGTITPDIGAAVLLALVTKVGV